MLLIPAHAVMLVSFAAEHLDNLSSARRLAVYATSLNPVSGVSAVLNWLGRHKFSSFATIKSLGPEFGIGDGANLAAVIYRCALTAQKHAFGHRASGVDAESYSSKRRRARRDSATTAFWAPRQRVRRGGSAEPRLSSRSPGDRGRYLIEAMQAPSFQRVTRLGATLAKVAVRQ